MDWLSKHFATLQPTVVAIFFGILLAGLTAYVWMGWGIRRARTALVDLAIVLESQNPSESDAELLKARIEAQPWLRQAWQATRRRVLQVPQGAEKRGMLLGTVADIWRPDRLLHKVFNFGLFEAVPNIAVGVGLFFTFLFLTFALQDATVALSGDGAANPVIATRDLLSSAGGKFLSSLAGLVVSIIWTVMGKLDLNRLERASARVVAAVEQRWPPVAAESVVVEQLSHLRAAGVTMAEHRDKALEHVVVSTDVLKETRAQTEMLKQSASDYLGLTDELLYEAREQTGVLKRFETDLAVSIGKAVTAGFGPQMEQMTARLEKAISDLSERMSSMNEDALRTMMKDFSQTITASTAEEMEKFRVTLTTLADQLDKAGGELKGKVDSAADALGEATGQMARGLEASTQQMTGDIAQAAQGLVASVQGMDAVMDKATGSVRIMDATLNRAAALGAQGAIKMDESLSSAADLLDRMGAVSQGWSQVSRDLGGLVAKLADASDGLDELALEQRNVVKSVAAAGPDVLKAVSEVRNQLEGLVRSVGEDMDRLQGALKGSSADLSGVVIAIKDGVVQYSQDLAKLHQAMDVQMAKAIGSLGGVVQNLDESIGELNDSLAELGLRK